MCCNKYTDVVGLMYQTAGVASMHCCCIHSVVYAADVYYTKFFPKLMPVCLLLGPQILMLCTLLHSMQCVGCALPLLAVWMLKPREHGGGLFTRLVHMLACLVHMLARQFAGCCTGTWVACLDAECCPRTCVHKYAVCVQHLSTLYVAHPVGCTWLYRYASCVFQLLLIHSHER